MTKLQGVNLGGWLLLEKWMTPTLFMGTDAVDEYTFMQTPGAREKLRAHQREFIREGDFAWMAKNGVNAVRIPVGYWTLHGDAPYVSCVGKLDWAFTMAKKYGIQVLVSFHGAQGSQNGQDHSGRIGPAVWRKNKQLQIESLQSLLELATRYCGHDYFWGIEILNEPVSQPIQWRLRRYYKKAYKELRGILPPNAKIVFSDAFTPRLMNGAIWGATRTDTVMDIHWYHFSAPLFKVLPLKQYYRLVAWHGRLLTRLRRTQMVIVGEWSGIIAGQILNKYPVAQHNELIKDHIARQQHAYQHADGWFYWSYKTEARGVWHFRSMVEDGQIHL